MKPLTPHAARSATLQDAPAILAVIDIHKRFGAIVALSGVSLRVERDQRIAIIGPNGAGKSTLFDLISGRARPSAGEIRLRGDRIDGLAPARIHQAGVARSFQAPNLFDRLSVFENLRCAVLAATRHRDVFWKSLTRYRAVAERCDALLEQLNLEPRRDMLAGALSYAEQRALELGITVAGDADVLLLDEPTAGMNRAETERFVALIDELARGKTLLMVEHDMSVVFGLADKVAVLDQGRLLAFYAPAAVRADARVQEAYLGVDRSVYDPR
jgi:branched-chain amino acid transport system ATP-binding protein